MIQVGNCRSRFPFFFYICQLTFFIHKGGKVKTYQFVKYTEFSYPEELKCEGLPGDGEGEEALEELEEVDFGFTDCEVVDRGDMGGRL